MFYGMLGNKPLIFRPTLQLHVSVLADCSLIRSVKTETCSCSCIKTHGSAGWNIKGLLSN